MAVFFTSDTHFGDPRVLRIDRRPFASLQEHDDALVARWNGIVGRDDEVWHLGDFTAFRKAEQVEGLLDALHGTKHLIVGNNDGPATCAARGWASVAHYAEIDVDGVHLVLCHYAFRTWNGMGKGVIDLHGHSHGRLTPAPRQYDVGVDAWDYTPVPLSTILSRRGRRPAAGQKARASRHGGHVVASHPKGEAG